MAKVRTSKGSAGMARGFARLQHEFGTPPPDPATATIPPGWTFFQGNWWQWSGTQWAYAPAGPSQVRPAVSDVRPFVATEVYNKVGVLAGMALVSGALAALLHLPLGVAMVFILAALVIGLVGIFTPRHAAVLAPVYAVLEGAALGSLSRVLEAQTHGVVALSIIGTGAIFLGTLLAYRTGLVRVRRRFVTITVVAGWGLLAVMLGVMMGINVPGLGPDATRIVVFGILYLLVATMDLFVDFEMVARAERAGVTAEGEWYAAFLIMFAVVMVYLALLRILGRR